MLGERITFCNLLSLGISFGGVILFTAPSFSEDDPAGKQNSVLGILLMILSSVLRALDVACMKALNKSALYRKAHPNSEIIVDIEDDDHHHAEFHYDLFHI